MGFCVQKIKESNASVYYVFFPHRCAKKQDWNMGIGRYFRFLLPKP
jgi:hypothetical protein